MQTPIRWTFLNDTKHFLKMNFILRYLDCKISPLHNYPSNIYIDLIDSRINCAISQLNSQKLVPKKGSENNNSHFVISSVQGLFPKNKFYYSEGRGQKNKYEQQQQQQQRNGTQYYIEHNNIWRINSTVFNRECVTSN
jgi:hypothetical protein